MHAFYDQSQWTGRRTFNNNACPEARSLDSVVQETCGRIPTITASTFHRNGEADIATPAQPISLSPITARGEIR